MGDDLLRKYLEPHCEFIFSVMNSQEEYPIENKSKHELVLDALVSVATLYKEESRCIICDFPKHLLVEI